LLMICLLVSTIVKYPYTLTILWYIFLHTMLAILKWNYIPI
jgi:hypothetical protein